MATYNNDFAKLRHTFLEFLHRLPFYGLAVLCLDDAKIRSILSEMSRPFVTYGIEEEADYRATLILYKGTKSHFVAERPDGNRLEVTLNLPGKHNVLNAMAAIAIASELNISDRAIQKALENFGGISRRFQIYGDFALENGGNVTLVDDYGHHPREIAATLQAGRQSWPERRFVMVYQPHRYTRTRDLFNDFCEVLSTCDALVLLDVYSAGESYIEGADASALTKAIQSRGKVDPIFVHQHHDLALILQKVLRDGDVLLMQGAGNIGVLASNLAQSRLRMAISQMIRSEVHYTSDS